MINHFLYSFGLAFKELFSKLASCYSLGGRNFPPKKIQNFLKNYFLDRIALKFVGMVKQPPSTYLKILVMIPLAGTLRTVLSKRTHLFGRLQRTKLRSGKTTELQPV